MTPRRRRVNTVQDLALYDFMITYIDNGVCFKHRISQDARSEHNARRAVIEWYLKRGCQVVRLNCVWVY